MSAQRAGSERRKVVTVVFADVVGSTALGERVDPETLRWAMQRWFGRMRVVIERHGGTIENYIGDAVMAVFGIPVAHEDDALRAVRAAAEMRAAVATLGDDLRRERGLDFAVRIGVNTGEAVTGAAAGGGFFTAGDMVNVAARLEQSAAPGDVLLGRDTYRLVRHAVEAEPVAPLTVKGKSQTLEAFRLLAVSQGAGVRPQRARAAMVNREAERRQLLGAFHEALEDRSCRLCTVLGAPGVGKSRLVADAVDSLQGRATVTTGRCLPYGDGMTWWPLVEALGGGLLEQAADDDAPAAERAAELLKPGGDPVAPDEAFWAVRKVLESLARRRPLVVVVDDLQWADPMFMDLLEHVAEWARGVPLFLLVMARPEVLDIRPGWGDGMPNASSVVLQPLPGPDTADLLSALVGAAALGPRAAAQILDVAEGIPLFVVEVVSMLVDDGLLSFDNRSEPAELEAIAVPPTIQALLAARLDRLSPAERAVIEAASIEGKQFERERIEALVADSLGESIAAELDALVRKELVEPFGAGQEMFRFRHQLVRDAAYEGMSKELRARLHERFADWLQARRSALPVVDELLGYHLERAVRLRRELGESVVVTQALALRASASLSEAGRRAAQRDDHAAASALLQRAIALVGDDDAARGPLLPMLGASLFEAGRVAEAIAILDRAAARAPEPWMGARARVEREFVRLETQTTVGTEHARRVADEVLPVLEREGDDHGQCRAWSLRALAEWTLGNVARADAAWGQATGCARRAGDERELFGIRGWRATAATLGPTPVDDGIRRCERLRGLVAPSPVAVAWVVNAMALLRAMRGDFEMAERLVQEANETLRELHSSSVSHMEAFVRLLAGEPARAERALRAGVEKLSAIGANDALATTYAMLAQALFAQERFVDAGEMGRAAARTAAVDDIVTQVIWRGVEAKLLARQGRCDEAQALAREAVALVEPTDLLGHRGDAMLDLAEVLGACSSVDAYHEAARAALALYVRKGNAVGAARARSLLTHRDGGG